MLKHQHLSLILIAGALCVNNSAIARFVSNDPVSALQHIQKGNIQGFNRYAYAINNPYKYVDPDGRDIAFSVDPDRADENGHTTLYFQNKEGNWNSYDQSPINFPLSDTGGSLQLALGMNSDAAVIIQQIDGPKEGSTVFETTKAEDTKIAESAFKSAKEHNNGSSSYNMYSNNCTDAAVDVVNNSGTKITVSNSTTTVKPNTWIKEVKIERKE